VKDRLVILTFHGIGHPPPQVEGSERSVWVDQDLYEATLDAVGQRLGKDVLITFDDGNRSDVEVALPALRRRAMRATFFVVADRLDQPGYLAANELRELADAGMTVGFHGLRHRSWRSLSERELADDLERGRALLEDALGRRVREASCPFGDYDRRVLRQLRRDGLERVYTSDGGTARAGAWLQPRTTIRSGWEPTPARLSGQDPARVRLVRGAKRAVMRLR
jgi:peptidoglycan/xylan/chitin deacetylase (PgdA/CDA1 family)